MVIDNKVAIIPARGGSKRVPNKNIRVLVNKPLIAYTIEVALSSSLIDRVIVTTEDKEIKKIAESYGAEVPFLRPKSLATNHAPDQPVIKHTVDWLRENDNYNTDVIFKLLPTTPLRTVEIIEKAYKKFLESSVDIVRSVTRVSPMYHPYWVFKMKKNTNSPTSFIEGISLAKYYNSQSLPPAFHLNSLVDVLKPEVANSLKTMMLEGVKYSLLECPPEISVDIDTEEDWQYCEYLLSVRN